MLVHSVIITVAPIQQPQKQEPQKASVFTEVCMSEVGQIFGRKCEQAAGRQLLLEQLINMHEKNTARY